MLIPSFPEFAPLDAGLKDEIHSCLSLTPDGVSEFTFAGFFLFRERYQYRVSRLKDNSLVFSGVEPAAMLPPPASESLPPAAREREKRFFITPSAVPERAAMEELFNTHDYWKLIPESVLAPERENLRARGIEFCEDRDNFDYLYRRSDLAELAGRKYHKKRNLVAQFLKAYTHEEKPLTQALMPEAMTVLALWRAEKEEDGDYDAAREALERFKELALSGMMFYIDREPAGFCLGEPVARGSVFAVHFEKALDRYTGIYQFMNQAFTSSLPESFSHINREQDLGEAGLRRAKMSYRPAGFVRKYTAFRGSGNGRVKGIHAAAQSANPLFDASAARGGVTRGAAE